MAAPGAARRTTSTGCRRLWLVPAVVLAGTAVACGNGSPSTGTHVAGSSGSPASASAPSSPLLVTSWRLLGVSADGRKLSISYADGGCVTFERLDVEQTKAFVRIAPLVRHEQRPGEVCPPLLRLERATVVLTQPLDGRQLIHPPATASATTRSS